MKLSTFLLIVAIIPVAIWSAKISPQEDLGSRDKSAIQRQEKLTHWQEKSAYQLTISSHQFQNKSSFIIQMKSSLQNKDLSVYNSEEIPLNKNKTLDKLIDKTIAAGQYPHKFHHDTLSGDFSEFFIKAHFKADNIDVIDFKTFKRHGETLVGKRNGTYRLRIPFGFGKLSGTVGKIELSVLFTRLHGSVVADVDKNSFLIDLEVTKTADNCRVSLKSFKVVQLVYTLTVKLFPQDQTWIKKLILKKALSVLRKLDRGFLEKTASRFVSEIFKKHPEFVCKLV